MSKLKDRVKEAWRKKEEAINRAEQGGSDTWITNAHKVMEHLANNYREFTSDEFWELIEKPKEPRVSGAIFRWAFERGMIEPTNEYISSTQKANHMRPIRVWRSLVYQENRKRR